MNKRASSSSAEKPATKKVKVTKAVAAPSGKKTGNEKPKASSSHHKAVSSKAGPSKVGPSKAGSNKADTSKAGSNKVDTSKGSSSKAGPSRAGTSKAVPSKAGSNKADTSKASSSKADTSKAKPSRASISNDSIGEHNQALTADELEKVKEETYDEELNEFVVERILDKDISLEGVAEYKVKWLGYSNRQCSWEAVHNLANSMKHVIKWEREKGQNWNAKQYDKQFDNIKRSVEIREERLRLTSGNYRIKEKYGVANGKAWYLMDLWGGGHEQVVCLDYPKDPYYKKINVKELYHVWKKGAWDDIPETEVAEDST